MSRKDVDDLVDDIKDAAPEVSKKQLENLKLEPENLASIKDAVQETFYQDEDLPIHYYIYLAIGFAHYYP